MENQEKDAKAYCDKKKCCGGKVLAMVALFAVGGAVGYLAAKCGLSQCAAPSAVAAPAK